MVPDERMVKPFPERTAATKEPLPQGDGIEVIEVVAPEIGFYVTNPAVAEALAKDFRDRAEYGFKKYGTRLRIRNGRDAIMDALQEGIDQAMYLRQGSLEEGLTPKAIALKGCYYLQLGILQVLKGLTMYQRRKAG